MGEERQDAAPRRESLLVSIGAVEHPADIEASADPPERRPDADDGAPLVNDGERLVAFTPIEESAAGGAGSADADPAVAKPAPSNPFAEFEAALAAEFPPPAAPPRPRWRVAWENLRVSRRDLRWIALGAATVLCLALLVIVVWARPACCGDADTAVPPFASGAPGLGSRTAPDAGASSGAGAGPSVPSGATGPPEYGDPAHPGAPAQPTAGSPVTGAPPAATTGAPVAVGGGHLTASYRTSKPSLLGLVGYQGEITISNPTSAPIGSWTVVVELRGQNTVSSADGAVYMRKDGQYWFIPAGEGTIAPGATYRFTFDVSGLLTGAPLSCAIDDVPCA
jgi:hypothetical protein